MRSKVPLLDDSGVAATGGTFFFFANITLVVT